MADSRKASSVHTASASSDISTAVRNWTKPSSPGGGGDEDVANGLEGVRRAVVIGRDHARGHPVRDGERQLDEGHGSERQDRSDRQGAERAHQHPELLLQDRLTGG